MLSVTVQQLYMRAICLLFKALGRPRHIHVCVPTGTSYTPTRAPRIGAAEGLGRSKDSSIGLNQWSVIASVVLSSHCTPRSPALMAFARRISS